MRFGNLGLGLQHSLQVVAGQLGVQFQRLRERASRAMVTGYAATACKIAQVQRPHTLGSQATTAV